MSSTTQHPDVLRPGVASPARKDNHARVYHAEFLKAVTLKKQGKHDECLAICFSLEKQTDLGLYRRAALNAFMAVILPYYYDPHKYAKRCIENCRLFRESRGKNGGRLGQDSEGCVGTLEECARGVLGMTEDQLRATWDVLNLVEDEGDLDRDEGREEVRGRGDDGKDLKGVKKVVERQLAWPWVDGNVVANTTSMQHVSDSEGTVKQDQLHTAISKLVEKELEEELEKDNGS